MKKLIFFIIVLLSSSMFLFAEKFIAQYADLKAELIPVLESPDKLSVDIILTNTTGRTCYVQNSSLSFEYIMYRTDYDDIVPRMMGAVLEMKDENGKDLPYIGIEIMPRVLNKWEKGEFTRLGKGKSITGHITNLFTSYPDAKNCEFITIYSTRLQAEPVIVKLR